ncbi:alpha/beta hydrolase [Ramlibacter henchirensis]|uniref:Alpha/beta hydrolase n=1 Tax=Ramlibacter henchirensis TaxID=204072 RepID=A0A4Z0C9D6_9BURK|nr:alpha/beta hydrolase [Ramlibacter henchirensis]TFZ07028.1 alpha/beta hydrolase [Ramlibacter henchirensis]
MTEPTTSARREPWPSHAAGAVRDLRGGMRLLVDAVRSGLDRVEAAHERVANVEPPVRGARIGRPYTGVGAIVYRGLRGTTDLAGGALDLALASLQAWLLDPLRETAPHEPVPAREAAIAMLNAIMGDHLHRTDNPLAIHLELRSSVAAAQPRVLLMVHDLARNDLQWDQGTHDHAQALAQALACTPVHALYNTGRPVPATGRELAAELEVLLAHWRVPLQGVALLGHGMGGLVVRSALHQAQRAGMAWPAHVRHLVFLGTPHHGADASGDLLARLGFGPVAWLPQLARVARRRSPGMRDFLEGRVLEDETRVGLPTTQQWTAGVPSGVPAHAIAGSIGDGRTDGVVPVDSALGRHAEAVRDLLLPTEHRWVIQGVDHLGLLRSEAVFQKMRQWLSA